MNYAVANDTTIATGKNWAVTIINFEANPYTKK
jgi:hypothetical protein